jgi:hypothetical protein
MTGPYRITIEAMTGPVFRRAVDVLKFVVEVAPELSPDARARLLHRAYEMLEELERTLAATPEGR